MVLFLSLFAACSNSSSTSQSTPFQSEEPVQVQLGPTNPVDSPVTPEELTAIYPRLSSLSKYPMLAAVGTMNLVPGPCGPCEDSLARCALAPPAGCENLPVLVQRAILLAEEGKDPDQLRAALTYPDIWIDDPTSGQTEAVDIEVWIDPSTPTVPGTLARISELREVVGEVPVRVHLRVLWNDAAEGELAEALALLAAEEQDAGLSLLEAGGVVPGVIPDAAVFEARSAEPALRSRLDAELAVSRTKGVRAAPTWFVEGYRLRGLQSTASISHLVSLAWEDTRLASSELEVVTP